MVLMEDVRVPASRMLGGEAGLGKGFNIAMDGINGGRLTPPFFFWFALVFPIPFVLWACLQLDLKSLAHISSTHPHTCFFLVCLFGFVFACMAGRINIASCSVGGAQAALLQTVEYMKERKQFGKHLTEFQALQFRLADYAADLSASRQVVRLAARELDAKSRCVCVRVCARVFVRACACVRVCACVRDCHFVFAVTEIETMLFPLAPCLACSHTFSPPFFLMYCYCFVVAGGCSGAPALCAMAKLTATDRCFDIVNGCLQLHGGYGYLKDYKVRGGVCGVWCLWRVSWLTASTCSTACVRILPPTDSTIPEGLASAPDLGGLQRSDACHHQPRHAFSPLSKAPFCLARVFLPMKLKSRRREEQGEKEGEEEEKREKKANKRKINRT